MSACALATDANGSCVTDAGWVRPPASQGATQTTRSITVVSISKVSMVHHFCFTLLILCVCFNAARIYGKIVILRLKLTRLYRSVLDLLHFLSQWVSSDSLPLFNAYSYLIKILTFRYKIYTVTNNSKSNRFMCALRKPLTRVLLA